MIPVNKFIDQIQKTIPVTSFLWVSYFFQEDTEAKSPPYLNELHAEEFFLRGLWLYDSLLHL